jgi:hypothetical protein
MIKRIGVVTNESVKWYSVGQEINGRTIDQVVDRGIEYPDAMHFMYHALDASGNTIASIENCPTIVEYSTKEAAQ